MNEDQIEAVQRLHELRRECLDCPYINDLCGFCELEIRCMDLEKVAYPEPDDQPAF